MASGCNCLMFPCVRGASTLYFEYNTKPTVGRRRNIVGLNQECITITKFRLVNWWSSLLFAGLVFCSFCSIKTRKACRSKLMTPFLPGRTNPVSRYLKSIPNFERNFESVSSRIQRRKRQCPPIFNPTRNRATFAILPQTWKKIAIRLEHLFDLFSFLLLNSVFFCKLFNVLHREC